MDYKSQYLHPKWQKKRLEILERDGFMCINCSDIESTLHVHHKYYLPDTDVWNYPNESLVTLCNQCHALEERELKEYSTLLINTLRQRGFCGDDLRELASGFNQMGISESLNMLYNSGIVSRIISLFIRTGKL